MVYIYIYIYRERERQEVHDHVCKPSRLDSRQNWKMLRAKHLSNNTCLTQVFFKSGELHNKL